LAALLGARIRDLRKERGFSFDAFAEELGRGYVSDLERGKVVPTLATLAKVASVLELEIADLVAFGPSPRLELFTLTRELTPVQVRRLLREAKEMVAPKTPTPPSVALPNPRRTRTP
jgi:transcriptional regulator with XRE-family HTH domain